MPRQGRLHLVQTSDNFPEIDNPKPCHCHGHHFVAKDLIVRERRTGEVVKILTSVPGGFQEIEREVR